MADRSIRSIVAAFTLAAGIAVSAQVAPPSGLRFEAASIRPGPPGGPPISGTTVQGNRLRGTNASLLGLIRSVYFRDGLISEHQFVGGPDWIRTERWNIDAVAASAPTRTQFDEMLRALPPAPFKLRIR